MAQAPVSQHGQQMKAGKNEDEKYKITLVSVS
jgi:hypothetical protein